VQKARKQQKSGHDSTRRCPFPKQGLASEANPIRDPIKTPVVSINLLEWRTGVENPQRLASLGRVWGCARNAPRQPGRPQTTVGLRTSFRFIIIVCAADTDSVFLWLVSVSVSAISYHTAMFTIFKSTMSIMHLNRPSWVANNSFNAASTSQHLYPARVEVLGNESAVLLSCVGWFLPCGVSRSALLASRRSLCNCRTAFARDCELPWWALCWRSSGVAGVIKSPTD